MIEYVVLAAAAFAAGFVNAVGGGGSLITFPILLAFGYGAVSANVTSTTALFPGYVGGALAYRRELSSQVVRARSLASSSALGAVAGAAILLLAPASAFRAAVPFLVLFGCALLALQPWLQHHVHRLPGATRGEGSPPLRVSVFVAGAYGAYFGAGLGMILLAVLALFLADDLQRLNGLKSLLSVLINGVAVLAFALFGPVVWSIVAVMAVASLVGGRCGGAVARSLNPEILRFVIVAFGVAVAIRLFIS
ncbi:MAG TPA: sulfite exporter TauE/SafE family protein [Acidimicrobiia bacterium]|jgi:uncharacterized membrane protein YfcA|nr:sulfite exporter TauE/SafE family protein [Acidimicrobiia bacterium]